MSIDTVAVTGGSGYIGRATIDTLNAAGYRTVNLDRDRSGERPADAFYHVDLLDAGDVYGALARSNADAVVHLGTITDPLHHPGYVTYRSNVMTSYHVLEAAEVLELEAVCLASSINAIGWVFQETPPEIRYLPVDEGHPATPRDPYALGKRVLEVTAAGFGRRTGTKQTISTIRLPSPLTADDLREHPGSELTLERLKQEYDASDSPLFTYVFLGDLARMIQKAIEADFDGHETFWVAAADTRVAAPTSELIAEFHPNVDVRSTPSGNGGLISIDKARRVLGWEPTTSWRDFQ